MRNTLQNLAWLSGVYRPPDRRVLEDTILPCFTDGRYGTVMFVGTRFYTRKYRRMFRAGSLVTVDIDPRMARHGAARHITANVAEIDRHVNAHSVDAIILSGVIGWGINDTAALDRTLRACHRTLRTGGDLVIGVNPLRSETPLLSSADALSLFTPSLFGPLGASVHAVRTPFPEQIHEFSFWRSL